MPKIVAKKEDWINLGYRIFSEQGASGIVVEKMAKILKVNKSSFYWHFKTQKDFIENLITFWIKNETERIIFLSDSKKTGTQKFKALFSLVYKQDPFLDFIFHLKRYSRKEKKIQLIIDNIDNKRIKYTYDLLLEMGYSKQDARIKSKLLYKHFLGYHELNRNKTQGDDYLKVVKKEIDQFIKF
jgi:AcrR family transcriptional regulator